MDLNEAVLVDKRHQRQVSALLIGHALLRTSVVASGASALAGFYLADLAAAGRAIDAGTVGLVNGALDVAVLAAAIPLGLLVDRRSPRFVLVLGAFLGALATQLFGATSWVALFVVARLIEGLGFAAVNPAILAHLAEVTQGNAPRRARVMSWYELTIFAGVALGSGFSGPLWEQFGRAAFSMLAVLYLLAATMFWWTTRRQRVARSAISVVKPWEGLQDALRDPQLRQLAPAWLAANAIIGLWLAHIVFQLSGPPAEGQWLVGRLTPTQVSIAALLYSLLFGGGVLVWGLVIGRFGRVRTMRVSFIGIMGVNIAFFLLNSSGGWPLWGRGVVLVVYGILVMVQSGFTPAALAFLADVAGRSRGRGSAMGIYTVLLSLGNIIGAAVGAVLARPLAINGLLIGSVLLTIMGLVALGTLRASAAPATAPEPEMLPAD